MVRPGAGKPFPLFCAWGERVYKAGRGLALVPSLILLCSHVCSVISAQYRLATNSCAWCCDQQVAIQLFQGRNFAVSTDLHRSYTESNVMVENYDSDLGELSS